ncbi:undecaprenyl diphosphate synthase family protein, partial [bacterium]|nr:undecaprenyl diphosphate synthase family protein [bacterium]
LSYAEIWVTDTYWPDFGQAEYVKAILDYQNRQRRFGKHNG